MNPIDKSQAPQAGNCHHLEHALLLIDSFRRLCGRPLMPDVDFRKTQDNAFNPNSLAKSLFEADFVVVSHGTEADPIFNYANQQALAVFEMNWDEFVALPSRKSAEPLHRNERAKLMQTVSENGFIDNYAGVRISSRGRRFEIASAIVWNVIDACGVLRGQAATFDKINYL